MRNPFQITEPTCISFSGGRTSAYMLWRVLQAHDGKLPDEAVVCFANTGMEASKAIMKYGTKKDANHHEVVDALKKAGAYVIDMSHVGCGFPDLIVGFQGKTMLMEIKNLKTAYGKKGLNKNQLKWREQWTGGTYCVVSCPETAIAMLMVAK